MSKKYIVGIYNDDEVVVNAVKKIRENGVKVHDVLSPHAVHGIDDALGLKESRLHITGFIYGISGTAFAFWFMTWIFTSDWPINFGGKPHFSFPAFIPIMFEFTVLCSAIGMTLTWLIRCRMYPGKLREMIDERTTDDKFGVVFNIDNNTPSTDIEKINTLLKETGAEEIKERELKRRY